MNLLIYFILISGIFSIVRLCTYLISSDIYSLQLQQKAKNFKTKYYRPAITIIIPAHNEELVIERTLESLQHVSYPKSRLNIIVVDDGSTDNTVRIIRKFIREQNQRTKHGGSKFFPLRLIAQRNTGKAEALNNALKRYVRTPLVMCLDADSILASNAIVNAVQYFRDKKVAAVASNVNVVENGTILGLLQRFEYLISHQLKKAHTVLNTEYIIGGVGSTFRRSVLQDISYYDTNTYTEDIDLTMKIVARGNRIHKVMYASNVITYTEPVLTFRALVNQRFRWKFGRLQTFYKNKHLFLNNNPMYSRLLTCLLLPLTLMYEITMLAEPFILGFLLYLSIVNNDPQTFVFAVTIFTSVSVINIWSSEHITAKEKTRLSMYAPPMYFLFFILSLVEYIAVIRSVLRIHTLRKSLNSNKTTWQSPQRSATALEA